MRVYTDYSIISIIPAFPPLHQLNHSNDDYDTSNRDLSDTEIVIE